MTRRWNTSTPTSSIDLQIRRPIQTHSEQGDHRDDDDDHVHDHDGGHDDHDGDIDDDHDHDNDDDCHDNDDHDNDDHDCVNDNDNNEDDDKTTKPLAMNWYIELYISRESKYSLWLK